MSAPFDPAEYFPPFVPVLPPNLPPGTDPKTVLRLMGAMRVTGLTGGTVQGVYREDSPGSGGAGGFGASGWHYVGTLVIQVGDGKLPDDLGWLAPHMVTLAGIITPDPSTTNDKNMGDVHGMKEPFAPGGLSNFKPPPGG